LHLYTAPDLGGTRVQGPPPKVVPHHVHMLSHTFEMCV